MGKKSRRKPDKKSKEERKRDTKAAREGVVTTVLPRRSPPTTCCHMTLSVDDEQRKEIKIFMLNLLRGECARSNFKLKGMRNFLEQNNPVVDLLLSPAIRKNLRGVAQLLLASITNYLIEYDFDFIRGIYKGVLHAYWVFEELLRYDVDPTDEITVLKVLLLVRK